MRVSPAFHSLVIQSGSIRNMRILSPRNTVYSPNCVFSSERMCRRFMGKSDNIAPETNQFPVELR